MRRQASPYQQALESLREAVSVIDYHDNVDTYYALYRLYRWVCPVCLTPFRSYMSFKLHVRYEEKGGKCPYCGKEFTKAEWLFDHISKKHGIFVSLKSRGGTSHRSGGSDDPTEDPSRPSLLA